MEIEQQLNRNLKAFGLSCCIISTFVAGSRRLYIHSPLGYCLRRTPHLVSSRIRQILRLDSRPGSQNNPSLAQLSDSRLTDTYLAVARLCSIGVGVSSCPNSSYSWPSYAFCGVRPRKYDKLQAFYHFSASFVFKESCNTV